MPRLEVRLEEAQQARLRAVAEARGRTSSEVVRELIDQAFEELERAERIAAVEDMATMHAFDLGSPEELEAEIETMYDGPPGLR